MSEQYFCSHIFQFIIPGNCDGWDVSNSLEMEIICLTQPAARLEHPSLYNLRCSKRIPVTNAADVKREILQLLLKVWEPRPGCQRSRSSVQQESAGAPQPGRSGLLIPVGHHQSLPLTSQGSGQVLSWFLLWTEGSVQAWKCLPVLLGNQSLAQLSHSEAEKTGQGKSGHWGNSGAFPASGIPKSDPAGIVQNIQCKGYQSFMDGGNSGN